VQDHTTAGACGEHEFGAKGLVQTVTPLSENTGTGADSARVLATPSGLADSEADYKKIGFRVFDTITNAKCPLRRQ